MDLILLRTWPTDDEISEALHLTHTEAIALLKMVNSSSSELCSPCDLSLSSGTSLAEDEEVSTSRTEQPILSSASKDEALHFAAAIMVSSEGLLQEPIQPEQDCTSVAILNIGKQVESSLQQTKTTGSVGERPYPETFESGFNLAILPKIRASHEDCTHGKLKASSIHSESLSQHPKDSQFKPNAVSKLLAELQREEERSAGRARKQRWSQRTKLAPHPE